MIEQAKVLCIDNLGLFMDFIGSLQRSDSFHKAYRASTFVFHYLLSKLVQFFGKIRPSFRP